MAGRKEYELLFKLQAALGKNFNSSFSKALNTTKELQSTLSKINSTSKKIDGYERQSNAVDKNRKKLESLKEEHEKLQRKMEQTEKPTEALNKKFQQNEKQIAAVTTKIENQERKLESLGRELKDAGIDTGNLTTANDKLKKSYDRLKKSQEELAAISAAQEKNAAAISKTKAQLATTIGVIGAVGTAVYAGPVKSAMDFQSSMADVVKVVDGLKDAKTGKLTEDYTKMSEALLDLSTKIPISAEGLTQIAAAAGQAGIARKEIVKFAEDAGKMGIAFDVSADQAGDWMAKWRTSFSMTQEEVVSLADKINYLSNNSASTAAEISNIVSKIGPLGKVAGLSSGALSAMGATLVSVGVNDDVAATGIKKVMTSMTAGTAATKRQKAVLDKMGISATDLAKRMQTDAQGAILDFMASINKLPKAEQAAALKNYFGEESVAAIAPMLSNLDQLKTNFDRVGSSASYAGSMESEFTARADTGANKVEMAKASIKKLNIEIGNVFLPYVGQAAGKLSDLVNKFSDFASKNPELVKTITKVGAAFAGTVVAEQTAKLGFLKLRDSVYDVQKVFGKLKKHFAESSAEAVTGGGKFAELGKKMSGYFGGVKNSLGGVDTAVSKFNFAQKLMGKFNAGSLGEVISGGMSGVTSKILSPFQKIGGKLNGFLSPIGKNVTGFFGKIGGTIANGPLGKIGGLFKSIGGVAGSVLSPAIKGLGSAFGGLFGKAMPIIMIISLLSALFLKLNGEDMSGFIEPIKQAFEQVKPTLQTVMEQLSALGEQLMPLLLDAAKQLAPLFGQLVAGILPVAAEIIAQIVPLIAQLVTQLLPVILNIITTLAPLLTEVITAILPVIVQLIQILLPIITQLVTQVLPIIIDVLNQILPIITQIIQTILPVIVSLLQALMPVITVLANIISSALGAALQAVTPILNGLITILKGIITFITGVFTGNWKQAWEGIKQIFGGVFTSLVELVKAPFRVIVGVINGVIGGLNKLKVPDWVPGIGGKGINIPLIPTFAKGTPKTPDTFIAGERGAELITNARNRAVFTAAQTGNILKNIGGVVSAVRSSSGAPGGFPQLQMAYAGAGGVSAPSVRAESPRSSSIVIHSEPKFYVGKDTDTSEIEEALKRHDEELLKEVEERQRKKEDDERRTRYE